MESQEQGLPLQAAPLLPSANACRSLLKTYDHRQFADATTPLRKPTGTSKRTAPLCWRWTCCELILAIVGQKANLPRTGKLLEQGPPRSFQHVEHMYDQGPYAKPGGQPERRWSRLNRAQLPCTQSLGALLNENRYRAWVGSVKSFYTLTCNLTHFTLFCNSLAAPAVVTGRLPYSAVSLTAITATSAQFHRALHEWGPLFDREFIMMEITRHLLHPSSRG